jgi:hypothetical protein
MGDFNGDGTPDLVTVNYNSGTVSVLLGNGDGSFQPHVDYPAGGFTANSVAVGDFNGDGRLDLAVTNSNQRTVSVLLGNGDGSFQLPVAYAIGATPRAVTVADLTGNGILDLIVADLLAGGDRVSVLLGNGDGTFQPSVSYTAGGSDAVAVGDLNGDGIPDLVTTTQNSNGANGSVNVLLGNGDGSFQAPVRYTVGSPYPSSVAVADLTGDGIPDLAVSNRNYDRAPGTVSVLRGNGDGSFRAAVNYPLVGSDPTTIVVADMNGNGIPDLVVSTSNNVNVLLGHGDGSVGPATAYSITDSFTDRGNMTVGDFNGDGAPDLAVTSADNTVTVLLNQGDGTFPGSPTYAVGRFPHAVAVGDFQRAGALGVVTANFNSNTVSVLAGNGDGTLQRAVDYAVGTEPNAVAMSDLTGNGILDLVTANFGSNNVSILMGNGDGTFQTAVNYPVDGGPSSVAVADFDGDGIPDLVTANFGYRGSNHTISVLRGNGDGTFQPAVTYSVNPGPFAVAAADLTGDGKPDLVITNLGGSGDTISVLLGNGDGTFRAPVNYPVGSRPYAVLVADLNGDGKPDLVTANTFSQSVSVLRGNGDGTFQGPQYYAVDGTPRALAVMDLNHDGILDLVAGSDYLGRYGRGSVSVLLGNGDGSFQSRLTYPVDTSIWALAGGDFNGDGLPDLVSASGNGTVKLLLNDGQWPQTLSGKSSREYGATATDLQFGNVGSQLGGMALTSSPLTNPLRPSSPRIAAAPVIVVPSWEEDGAAPVMPAGTTDGRPVRRISSVPRVGPDDVLGIDAFYASAADLIGGQTGLLDAVGTPK